MLFEPEHVDMFFWFFCVFVWFSNRNVVKAYYTAGIIYDILLTFGELTEEATDKRKYAKYKAAYIHNCLKNGETPIPGPPNNNADENDDDNNGVNEANVDTPSAGDTFPTPKEPGTDGASRNSPIIDFKPHPIEINGARKMFAVILTSKHHNSIIFPLIYVYIRLLFIL